jgi:hypothetical protein
MERGHQWHKQIVAVLSRLLSKAFSLYETFRLKPGRSILYADTNLWSNTAACDTLKAHFTQIS